MITFVIKKNRFLQMIPLARVALGRGTMASSERIAADARSRYSASPGDTGKMREETVARKIGPLGSVAVSGAPYAVFQDRGTSRGVPATHFFTGAVQAEEAKFGPAMAAEIKSALGG